MKNLLLFLMVLISSTVFGQGQGKNFIDQNYIEVTGKDEMEVAPDRIYLKIIINEKEVKGKSLSETERSMVAKLQEIGIDTKKDLSVKDLASNFKNYWILKPDIVLTKEYQLLVKEARTAGRVFQELQQLGISNISIEKIENSKIDEYRKAVKINAMKSAQDKAKSLAAAISQEIGKAIYIQEIESGAFYAFAGKAAGIQVRGANLLSATGQPEPDIEFDKIKLEYSIVARFELK